MTRSAKVDVIIAYVGLAVRPWPGEEIREAIKPAKQIIVP